MPEDQENPVAELPTEDPPAAVIENPDGDPVVAVGGEDGETVVDEAERLEVDPEPVLPADAADDLADVEDGEVVDLASDDDVEG